VVGIALPTFLLLMSESSMYQKFSSADNAANAKKAVMGMFMGVVLVELLMMLIALVGFAIYADDPRFFLADGSIDRAMAEEIILRIGFEQLPVIVGSLLLAAGAAIIISTGNTFRDIFQAFFFKDANPQQVVVMQRATIVGIGVLAYLLMSQFETILEMALISYTMIGASLAPPLLAAFFWKRVTRSGGVASIAAGMLTVIGIAALNAIYKDSDAGPAFLGISFPMDTDYIAIPAVIVSVLTLVIVSLLTARPEEADWREFITDD
jgi:SSS family solute:Na+ symporter/sodium/proline symporter